MLRRVPQERIRNGCARRHLIFRNVEVADEDFVEDITECVDPTMPSGVGRMVEPNAITQKRDLGVHARSEPVDFRIACLTVQHPLGKALKLHVILDRRLECGQYFVEKAIEIGQCWPAVDASDVSLILDLPRVARGTR
jgi:hypothetical protein